DAGKFPQAVDYRLARFTEFPAAITADRDRYAGKTVVSYSTGGIRCEKAALHMQALGMQRVFQLDGGILKYFEDTGGAHWQGDCFVFDERGAVDPSLAPSTPAGANLSPRPSPQRGEEAREQGDHPLPLPLGERVGVRGHAGAEASSEAALADIPASTRPSPQSSPQRREEDRP
ncbi:MAG TPA: sulfurtransferase, partial [Dyella sp.]|nr:sulfurtransferase [Dyella sp.]